MPFDESLHPRDKIGQFTDAGIAIQRAASDEKDIEDINTVEDKIRDQKFESAGLFKDGNKVFFKDGEAVQVGFTQEEVDLMKGGTLTHNHPGGRSFTPEDLRLFNRRELKELRAVSKNADYSVQRGIKSFSESEVDKVFIESYAETRKEFDAAINSGQITKKFANREIHHEMMNKISKKLEWKYKRKIVNKDFFNE